MVHPHDKSFATRRDICGNNCSPFYDPTHFERLSNTIWSSICHKRHRILYHHEVLIAILHLFSSIASSSTPSSSPFFFFFFFFFFQTIFVGLVFLRTVQTLFFRMALYPRQSFRSAFLLYTEICPFVPKNTKTSWPDGAHASCANIIVDIILHKTVSNGKYRL